MASWKVWRQQRYVLTFLVFLGYFNIYSLRTNLSIAIVAMVQDRYATLENGTEINLVSILRILQNFLNNGCIFRVQSLHGTTGSKDTP